MSASNEAQLAAWANAVLEEVLVEAAIGLHRRERSHEPIQVSLTFEIVAKTDSGNVLVRSLGSRGQSIHVQVRATGGNP